MMHNPLTPLSSQLPSHLCPLRQVPRPLPTTPQTHQEKEKEEEDVK